MNQEDNSTRPGANSFEYAKLFPVDVILTKYIFTSIAEKRATSMDENTRDALWMFLEKAAKPREFMAVEQTSASSHDLLMAKKEEGDRTHRTFIWVWKGEQIPDEITSQSHTYFIFGDDAGFPPEISRTAYHLILADTSMRGLKQMWEITQASNCSIQHIECLLYGANSGKDSTNFPHRMMRMGDEVREALKRVARVCAQHPNTRGATSLNYSGPKKVQAQGASPAPSTSQSRGPRDLKRQFKPVVRDAATTPMSRRPTYSSPEPAYINMKDLDYVDVPNVQTKDCCHPDCVLLEDHHVHPVLIQAEPVKSTMQTKEVQTKEPTAQNKEILAQTPVTHRKVEVEKKPPKPLSLPHQRQKESRSPKAQSASSRTD